MKENNNNECVSSKYEIGDSITFVRSQQKRVCAIIYLYNFLLFDCKEEFYHVPVKQQFNLRSSVHSLLS